MIKEFQEIIEEAEAICKRIGAEDFDEAIRILEERKARGQPLLAPSE